jgi:mono/diheme cytochrome c family protein
MNDVVVHSMRHLNDGDLASIAAYLKTLPPNNAAAPYAYEAAAAAKALFNGEAPTRGAQIYVDRCAGCRTDGKGSGQVFPSLAGNSVLQTDDATSAIHIVLSGSTLPQRRLRLPPLTMAPYARILTDQDIADVVSFIPTSWENAGAVVTSSKVTALRKLAK